MSVKLARSLKLITALYENKDGMSNDQIENLLCTSRFSANVAKNIAIDSNDIFKMQIRKDILFFHVAHREYAESLRKDAQAKQAEIAKEGARRRSRIRAEKLRLERKPFLEAKKLARAEKRRIKDEKNKADKLAKKELNKRLREQAKERLKKESKEAKKQRELEAYRKKCVAEQAEREAKAKALEIKKREERNKLNLVEKINPQLLARSSNDEHIYRFLKAFQPSQIAA